MKKLILPLMMIFMLFSCCSSVCAEEEKDPILSASGAEDLDTGELLEDAGVTFDDPQSILSLTPSKIWDMLKGMVKDRIYAPLRLFAMILVLIILASVMQGAGGTIRTKDMSKIFELVCVMSCIAALTSSICGCLDGVSSALDEGGKFMAGFVPVFSGVTAASGNITSASGYSFLVLGFSEIAVKISESFFMPLLSMCMSIGIVDACCDGINLSGMINAVKKIVTWGLGLVMTVFTGLLSVQSIVGASADTLSSKTAKYLISNSVPLVGAAASEAYATVRGSISLLKNGIGGIGVAVLAVMLLPPLIHMILYKLCFGGLGIVSEVFGTKKLAALFKNVNAVLSAALSILVCFILMFIISTGIVMTFCSQT